MNVEADFNFEEMPLWSFRAADGTEWRGLLVNGTARMDTVAELALAKIHNLNLKTGGAA